MNLVGIVFSRDRALQLDGTLASFFRHCRAWPEGFRVQVIYKATTECHQRQYRELARAYEARPVDFLAQGQFRDDVLRLLSPGAAQAASPRLSDRVVNRLSRQLGWPLPAWLPKGAPRQVLFLVDDNIFVQPFDLVAVGQLLSQHANALGFTLRLGENTTDCYPLDRPQNVPVPVWFTPTEMKYRWLEADGDFGYPLEVSSSVYRTEDVFPVLRRKAFANPNQLEDQLARQAAAFRRTRPNLLCFRRSVTFCNPLNQVQVEAGFKNRSGDSAQFTSEALAQHFDEGYRLDVEALAGWVPSACHQEMPLTFRKVEG